MDPGDTDAAPSEFLAEFLSAMMRREYAAALQYCALILQHEPHNAAARAVYPLLRRRLRRAEPEETSSGSERSASGGAGEARTPHQTEAASMEQEDDSEGSASLDSDEADEADDSESARSCSAGSSSDHNGNLPPPLSSAGDVANHNAALEEGRAAAQPCLLETSLQRLRAHYSCSIK